MAQLEVSLEGNAHRISLCLGTAQKTLRGKAVQFILALVAHDFPAYLGRNELHGLNDWVSMTIESVGKQAARIVDDLAHAGFPIIEWEHKTSAWRLGEKYARTLPQDIVALAKTHVAESSWSRAFRFRDVPAGELAKWMELCGSALIDMTEGMAAAGYEKLRTAYTLSGHEGMTAISDVLATRMGQALPKPHLRVAPNSTPTSLFEIAAAARGLAAHARRSTALEWQPLYYRLQRELLTVITTGDTTTQAVVFNALAILARRLGWLDQALENIREAAPLAIFSGDLVLIQNISFNFGNILNGCARHAPETVDPEDYFRLLALDIEMRARLHIGKDSAQAELLCAYLYWEHGDIQKSYEQLAHAAPIVANNQQPYDVALYDRVTGLLFCTEHHPDSLAFSQGMAALEAAQLRYTDLGNSFAALEVEADIKRYRPTPRLVASAPE